MSTPQRLQLAHLDQSILALFNERSRLFSEAQEGGGQLQAAIDDLLRRNPGPFPADATRRAFAAIDEGCSPAGAAQAFRSNH